MKHSKHLLGATVATALLALVGCGAEEKNPSMFSLDITDAPVDDATAVVVEFTGVEIKPANGPSINVDYDTPRQINLLPLQEGESEPLVTDLEVEAGAYNWIRLKVNAQAGVTDSYIELDDGTMHSLYVPSGSQTGLKLNTGFNVAQGQDVNFTIDFDLRKSIVKPSSANSDYKLKPSLRIVDNTEIGEIAGTVSTVTMQENAECVENGAVVYVFEGEDVRADDLGSAVEPLSSANVNWDSSGSTYDYVAAFLAPGEFTVSLTCQATLDAPELDDEIVFVESFNATVLADTTTEVNFN